MMGHINNLVVELVQESLGAEAVPKLFAAAGLPQRRYQSERIYPEEEFQALFRGAQDVFAVDSDAAEHVFAQFFMRRSPEMFPAIFEQAGSARRLIELVPQIHRSFPASMSQDAFREKIAIRESTPARLVLHYCSPNRLCITLKDAAALCLQHFGERGDVHESGCQKEGAPHCTIAIEFHGPAHE